MSQNHTSDCLKSVSQEATSMPHLILLVGPHDDDQDDNDDEDQCIDDAQE